ncbi:uncharacterized protein [Leptinotarsa decemlineata]|uniref:uncharacterized protein n=1 Tax=Leptinotarsa decemlineata TaxID=7539 RepID=UPI000C254706|nr:uncharacterized protein LOC111511948 isoform X2 [Leptinotarsa decemlineata]
MKLCFGIVLAITVLVLANAETTKEKYLRFDSECKKPDAIKSHDLCMNVKFGLQKENGDIDKDVLRAKFGQNLKISADELNEMINECSVRKGNTAAEAGDALSQCIRKYLAPVYSEVE